MNKQASLFGKFKVISFSSYKKGNNASSRRITDVIMKISIPPPEKIQYREAEQRITNFHERSLNDLRKSAIATGNHVTDRSVDITLCTESKYPPNVKVIAEMAAASSEVFSSFSSRNIKMADRKKWRTIVRLNAKSKEKIR